LINISSKEDARIFGVIKMTRVTGLGTVFLEGRKMPDKFMSIFNKVNDGRWIGTLVPNLN